MKVEEAGYEAGDQLHHSLVLEVVAVLAELEGVNSPEGEQDKPEQGPGGKLDWKYKQPFPTQTHLQTAHYNTAIPISLTPSRRPVGSW